MCAAAQARPPRIWCVVQTLEFGILGGSEVAAEALNSTLDDMTVVVSKEGTYFGGQSSSRSI